jgi:fumarate hydratase subunit beta
MKKIKTPLKRSDIKNLKSGDEVLLTGTIYTARDQAHKRLAQSLKKNKKLPFDLKGAVIYYCGPTKTPPGKITGSCGPTTSRRMDEFTPCLLDKGLLAMIGKGSRSKEVAAAIRKNKAVYFLALAGCGALLSRCVRSSKAAAYRELGPEAVFRLEVVDFPLIVGIDSKGKGVYKQE